MLCHRLGSSNVVSIDIDPTLVVAARNRLAGLGPHPTLVVGDGTAGAAQHGPYDRIIATAAVPMIPLPWLEQRAPGGKILANLRGEGAGVTLCLLTKKGLLTKKSLLTKKDDDEVIGPLLPIGGHFMWLRPQTGSPLRVPEPPRTRSSRNAATAPAASAIRESTTRALAPPATGCSSTRATSSYAEVITSPEPGKQHPVIQAGPRRLWDSVETAYQLWCHLDRPDPGRFGVVANPTTQFVWFDTDEGWYRWSLPLA